jgi:predicted Zn-ribbon and HTH transcriptional regulator
MKVKIIDFSEALERKRDAIEERQTMDKLLSRRPNRCNKCGGFVDLDHFWDGGIKRLVRQWKCLNCGRRF